MAASTPSSLPLLMSRRLFTFREERSWEAFRSSRRDREAFGDNNNASSPKHRERHWNKMVQVTLINIKSVQYFKEIVSWLWLSYLTTQSYFTVLFQNILNNYIFIDLYLFCKIYCQDCLLPVNAFIIGSI
jgi:hypothetical protein